MPHRSRRILLHVQHVQHVQHGHPARVTTAPATVLAVDIGAPYAYYLTPLFGAAETHSVLHATVHLHMLVAGCLLSWYLVGITFAGSPITYGERPASRCELGKDGVAAVVVDAR